MKLAVAEERRRSMIREIASLACVIELTQKNDQRK